MSLTNAMASNALVSDIKGVCRSGETRRITSKPMNAASMKTYRLVIRSAFIGLIASLNSEKQIPRGLNITPRSATTALRGDPGSPARNDNKDIDAGPSTALRAGSKGQHYPVTATVGPSLRVLVKAEEQRLLGNRLGFLHQRSQLLVVEWREFARQLYVVLQLRNGIASDDNG